MDQQTTTTFRDYVRVLFRHKSVILLAFIVVVGTVFIGLKLQTKVYEGKVKLLISAEKQVEAPYYRELIGYHRNAEITLTQSEIVRSEPVLERVVRSLALYAQPLDYEKQFASGIKQLLIDWQIALFKRKVADLTEEQVQAYRYREAVDALKERIEVEPIRDTNLFTISVKDFSPVGATIIANVVSRSYLIFDLEQQLVEVQLKYGKKHPQVRQLQDNINKMKEGLDGKPLANIDALGSASVKIVEQATPPLKPSGTPKVITFILALILGPFLGVMLAFVFEYMDQSMKTPQDIEDTLNLSCLGSIPQQRFLQARLILGNKDAKNKYTQSFQTIADQIHLLLRDKDIHTLLVTSVLPNEGTSTVVTNLGALLAHKLRNKVIIIDANLRMPSLHKTCKMTADKRCIGLANVLEGKTAFSNAVQRVEENLSVMPTGETALNPVTLLDSHTMHEVLKKAKEDYRIILIDCPNLRNFKDAYVLAAYSDAVVLVVKEGASRRQVVQSALAPFQTQKVPILGAILNNRTYPIPRFVYDMT